MKRPLIECSVVDKEFGEEEDRSQEELVEVKRPKSDSSL